MNQKEKDEQSVRKKTKIPIQREKLKLRKRNRKMHAILNFDNTLG